MSQHEANAEAWKIDKNYKSESMVITDGAGKVVALVTRGCDDPSGQQQKKVAETIVLSPIAMALIEEMAANPHCQCTDLTYCFSCRARNLVQPPSEEAEI